jgi:hypothetical protein
MKAELVKRQDRWDLYGEDGSKIASSAPNPIGKLSIKNCEAIANGYDLDELSTSRLATRFDENSGYHKFVFVEAYKEGFLKAMEILSDKKFSELDMRIAYDAGCNNIDADDNIDFQDTINSLQQTEWDVEVEQELIQSSIQGEAIWKTRLDADGCLILKRI